MMGVLNIVRRVRVITTLRRRWLDLRRFGAVRHAKVGMKHVKSALIKVAPNVEVGSGKPI